MAQFLRTCIFNVGYYFSGILFGTMVGIIGRFIPYPGRCSFIVNWNRFVLWWLRVSAGVTYQVHGRENLPTDGPYVIVCKHQSTWETILLQTMIIPVVTTLKRELLYIPFFGWALAYLNPIAIDRGSPRAALKQVMEQGMDRLKNGIPILIFPEGTRMEPGQAGNYARGGVSLALKAGVPVVPIAHNAGDIWPARKSPNSAGCIHMVIGEPIPTDSGLNAKQLNEQSKNWIEEQMQRISPNYP